MDMIALADGKNALERAVMDVLQFYKGCSIMWWDNLDAVPTKEVPAVQHAMAAKINYTGALSPLDLNKLVVLLNDINLKGLEYGLRGELSYDGQGGIVLDLVWTEGQAKPKRPEPEAPKPAPKKAEPEPPQTKKVEITRPPPAVVKEERPFRQEERKPIKEDKDELDELTEEELDDETGQPALVVKPKSDISTRVRAALEKPAKPSRPLESKTKKPSPLDDIFDDDADTKKEVDDLLLDAAEDDLL
jgi:hypothetical protein